MSRNTVRLKPADPAVRLGGDSGSGERIIGTALSGPAFTSNSHSFEVPPPGAGLARTRLYLPVLANGYRMTNWFELTMVTVAVLKIQASLGFRFIMLKTAIRGTPFKVAVAVTTYVPANELL